eukprot:13880-Heterococcus_DN1.PRE.3
MSTQHANTLVSAVSAHLSNAAMTFNLTTVDARPLPSRSRYQKNKSLYLSLAVFIMLAGDRAATTSA